MFFFRKVVSVSRPNWQCRIREGMAGMVRALWAPDARHIVTFSDFNLHMSVWSLSTRQVRLMQAHDLDARIRRLLSLGGRTHPHILL